MSPDQRTLHAAAHAPTKEKTTGKVSAATAASAFGGFSRVVTTIPLPHKPLVGKPEFEYREHGYIGDAITLTLADGTKKIAGDYPLPLQNGLQLTYGQINALAGDFYATADPISDGPTPAEQQQRFQNAFYWLATDTTRQPAECNNILALLKPEVDAVNLAVQLHKDPSIVYNGILPDINWDLNGVTSGRTQIPTYIGLARINWDHFGADARTAYNAGHAVALQAAASGNLIHAYTLNAFADHYLEDSFSAGHLRTPRRMLHSIDGAGDLCAKYMHDEDNAIGLSVKNPAGETWTVYGDKRALDTVNADNLQRCLKAIQASADEVYTAYKTRTLPQTYTAWNEAPTLESALQPQALAALFKLPNLCRSNLQDRKTEEYTSYWIFDTTAIELYTNSWWNYPISINGPQHIVPWTGVTACNGGNYLQTMVLYTNPDDGIRMSQVTQAYTWSGGPTSSSLATGSWFGSMASACWRRNDYPTYTLEGYLVYLDETYTVRVLHYLAGSWSSDSFSSLNIKTDWYTNMTATSWYDVASHTTSIRLYLQETGQTKLQEVCWDSSSKQWVRGATLNDAMKGTGLATIAVPSANGQSLGSLHLFYQTPDYVVRDLVWDSTLGWHSATDVQWTDAAPATGIAAALDQASNTGVNVFYTGSGQGNPLCQRASANSWTLNAQPQPAPRMNNILAAVTSDAGYPFRLYCQGSQGQILELRQGIYSKTWTSNVVASP